MGTRADFYVGYGDDAEWLGSMALDGYPAGIPRAVLDAPNEPTYRSAVQKMLEDEPRYNTLPEHGWPWPWKTSHTTDYAYTYREGQVWASCFGSSLFDPDEEPEDTDNKTADWPDMSENSSPTMGPRSGLLIFGSVQEESE